MLQIAAMIKNSCAGTLAFWGVKYFFEEGDLATEIVNGGVRAWGPTPHPWADFAFSGALISHTIDPAELTPILVPRELRRYRCSLQGGNQQRLTASRGRCGAANRGAS